MNTNGSDFRERLENWLLGSFDLILSPAGLKTFQARLKAMAEFALAAVVLADWEKSMSPWGQAIVDLVVERYRHPEIQTSLSANPDFAAAHAWIIEAARSRNVEFRWPEELVIKILKTRDRVGVDSQYPVARIEARYLAFRRSRGREGADNDTSHDGLTVSWSDNHSPADYRAIYQLVHEVFFLTDFGCHRWETGRVEIASQRLLLNRVLCQASEISLRRQQFDLVGEIALARLCLDPDSDVEFMLQVLGEAQQGDGRVPGWLGADGIEGSYHATLVALLAVARRDAAAVVRAKRDPASTESWRAK